VARLGWRKEIVHKIDISHESGMPECSVDRVRGAAAN
jgi:hypothetical protein